MELELLDKGKTLTVIQNVLYSLETSPRDWYHHLKNTFQNDIVILAPNKSIEYIVEETKEHCSIKTICSSNQASFVLLENDMTKKLDLNNNVIGMRMSRETYIKGVLKTKLFNEDKSIESIYNSIKRFPTTPLNAGWTKPPELFRAT